MDTALLLIRVVVGVLFVGHGTRKLFGWFEGAGIEGTARYFAGLGFRHSTRLAVVAGVVEAGGGLLLLLGFLTPLASLALTAMMVNAVLAAHWDAGLWNSRGGFEYPMVLGVVAVAFAFAGPGLVSVDALIGWQLWGEPWGVGVAIGGLFTSFLALGTRAAEHPAEQT